jgi:undecaprenyl-diphosphatase
MQTGGRAMGIPGGTSVHTGAGADGAKAHHGVAWLVVALLGLVGFVLLTVVVASKAVLPFDAPVLAFSQSLDGVPDVWRALSESANIPLVVIGLGMVIWLFATRRRGEALIVLVMLAAVTLGSEGVKELVARPRPSGTDPNIPGVVYSFPSGHVLEALTILGIIAIRGWRSSRPRAAMTAFVVAVIIWVALVGLARMALSAHFPSDVLASVLGGGGALGVYGWLTRRGNPRHESEP